MKSTFNIILFFLFAITPRQIYAQPKQLTMEGFVHNLSLHSPLAEIVKSTYQNELLQFDNYKKAIYHQLALLQILLVLIIL